MKRILEAKHGYLLQWFFEKPISNKTCFCVMIKIFTLLSLFTISSSMALINANPLVGHADLVRLKFESDESVCSGFFVNPTTIITAAHCFYSYKDERLLKLETVLTANDQKLELEVLKVIPHPEYYKGGWSPNDVGIIKTTTNSLFQGNFLISNEVVDRFGNVTFYGAGKIKLNPKEYGRSIGDNGYFRVGSFLCTLGWGTSIAPNDSGAPVVNKKTGKVIGIAAKSSAVLAPNFPLPIFTAATRIGLEGNWQFVQSNL